MSKYTFSTSVGRFRIISIAEGISYLLLLGIAMPLKYAAGIPEAVKYTGWAHGVLFVAYMIAGLDAAISQRWSFKIIFLAVIASLLPFGPFIFDKYFLKEEN
jgi:integral membrane protein